MLDEYPRHPYEHCDRVPYGKTKSCVMCHKPFQAWRNVVTCGKKCALERRRQITREAFRRWRKNNHDKAIAKERKYYRDNPEKCRDTSKRYRNANLEKVNARKRKAYRASKAH